MTSPETPRWVADRLRTEAGQLVPLLDDFIGAFGPEVWSGPAADAARHDLELERASLAEAALELEAIARAIDRDAARREAERAAQQ